MIYNIRWCGVCMLRLINISVYDMDNWFANGMDDVDSLHVEIEKS